MSFMDDVKAHKEALIHRLMQKQSKDGAWRYCFESGILTDAYMIMIMRTLDIDEEALIKELVVRILRKQEDDGYWKLFIDEKEGNLSTTIDAYNALLFSGYIKKTDLRMKKAAKYIRKKGGLNKAGLLTKVMLAMNGQYHWPSYFRRLPISVLLLPSFLPFSFFDFSSYARIHFVPIMIVSNRRYTAKTAWTPNLTHLSDKASWRDAERDEERSLLEKLIEPFRILVNLPKHIQQSALSYAEHYLLKRIEPNGTLYSYASSTFLMIYALLALGYKKNSPIIINAVNGLKSLICKFDDDLHVQNATSTIWDSALISYSIQEAGVPPENDQLVKTNQFLLTHQQSKYGDWALKSPHVKPGGWGFSEVNTIVPDVDDTTMALRAIYRYININDETVDAWNKGLTWLFALQNNDGGWPSFEKNTDHELLTYLPIKGVEEVAIDPSTADLTGRTLEFLGRSAGLTMENKDVQLAVAWLINHQEEDGSWFGRWGISYIYGTWAALTGLMAVGMSSSHPTIEKATKWLISIQNDDGGWGESCKSDSEKHYVPLGFSTLSQTSWAVDGLISVYNSRNVPIEKGIDFLIHSDHVPEYALTYPTGAGYPGEYYSYYHSYNESWPLLAIAHYLDIE